ncbi:MAG: cation:proton antiporter [marine bacterium B5-7]|nr:MAG: cation:proton antiporter [marine bacterium B5-7]
MIDEQLSVLAVVAPLLAAPLCVLMPRARWSWLLALVASVACFAISVRLFVLVQSDGMIVTPLGGWAAPWGIEYRVDPVNSLVMLIVSGISSVCLLSARLSINKEIDSSRQPLFYTAWLLCLSGLIGMTVTGDAFNLFVFLEISSLSSYVLIAMGRDRRALTASFQYLVMGTIGATFIIIGVGFLYLATGSLNMADIAVRLPDTIATRTMESALAFLTVGMGLKIAMFPLHLWLPNAYAYAPSVVSAFIAATATKVALYALIRFLFTIFGYQFSFVEMPLSAILAVLAVAAVLVASTVAIFERDIKRMLAYSSVAQIGYMLLGIAIASQAGVTASIAHIFNHALMKGALFLALACVVYQIGSVMRDDLTGLSRRMPWTFGAFTIASLSLIGMPLTAGFTSKWLLVQAALAAGWWMIALLVLIGSLLAVVYIWRVIEIMIRPPAENAPRQEAPLSLLAPAWILALANIYFGIFTGINIGSAKAAAIWLLGGVS